MATCLSMVVHETALMMLKSAVRLCLRQRAGLFTPRRCSHGARSSLYEHAREGYSDKPELDMRAVCEETDKVIANVENRKGDLRGDDVRKMVRCFHYWWWWNCFSADLTKHLYVHIIGVCVAGAPSSKDRHLQTGRAEGTHQRHGQGSGGQCMLDYTIVQLSNQFWIFPIINEGDWRALWIPHRPAMRRRHSPA